MTRTEEEHRKDQDPCGAGGEIQEGQYCCALCLHPNDGTFSWNPILEQLICGSCGRKLYHLFVRPASRAWLVELYPPIIVELMARSGRTYRECRRIYLEHEAACLTQEILDDEGTEGLKAIMAPDGSSLSCSELWAKASDLLRHYGI